MTPSELMALSRLYHQNHRLIENLMIEHLIENTPRITSVMFGVEREELVKLKRNLTGKK